MRTIGIAIPTYERPVMTFEVFTKVHNDPRVSAVEIVDDASVPTTWQTLVERARSWSKVQLTGGARNMGCYLNKYRTVLGATSPWVALIDSDNTIDAAYLDALYAVERWDPNTLYLPVLAQPPLDYRAFAGLAVIRETIVEHMHKPSFMTALNTGNFVVHRPTYLHVFDVGGSPAAADSLYFVYCWLASGRRLYFVPGMTYQHRVHLGYWMEHAEASTRIANYLTDCMYRNQWDVSCVA